MDLLTWIWPLPPSEAWLSDCALCLGSPAPVISHLASLGPVLGWHDLFILSSQQGWDTWRMSALVALYTITKKERSCLDPSNLSYWHVDTVTSFSLCKCRLSRDVFPDYGISNRILATLCPFTLLGHFFLLLLRVWVHFVWNRRL